jgi:hypothetical protein
VLERLAKRNVYAITSFIFGLDNDTPGVAARTLEQIATWPPVLPVFGQITPYPATPLYERLEREGRLTRPKHWLDFAAFRMAHKPLKMTPEQVEVEVRHAWKNSYSPAATRAAMRAMREDPVPYKISHLIARIFFSGIYFPRKSGWAWARVVLSNTRAIASLIWNAKRDWHGSAPRDRVLDFDTGIK